MASDLCMTCKNRDFAIEIRYGKTQEYETCMYCHHHFHRVEQPEQCRDYEREGDDDD